MPCNKIPAKWGAQRVKGLSISKAIAHACKKLFALRRKEDISQKSTETTLIERFLYPKFGPGQMWETVAKDVKQRGGSILHGWKVDRLVMENNRVSAVEAVCPTTGQRRLFQCDYVVLTMPIRDLVRAMAGSVPPDMAAIGEGLVYRDFLTVGLLLNKLKIRDKTKSGPVPIRDNWIYIQEPEVKVGRLQIFNNWSPFLVADPSKTWIGLEYFCNDTDPLWQMPDDQLAKMAAEELHSIEIIDKNDVVDSTVIRMEKTYPAYFGSYGKLPELRTYLDSIANLFLVGRNGMHRYNNQDHSMLTAITAVDGILSGNADKSAIWAINTEEEYHEEKNHA